MDETSVSLLDRLRLPQQEAAWVRFVDLYSPLLYHWAHRSGLRNEDVADLVQDILTTLVDKLPEFHYDKGRSFRGWLRTITLNRWRDLQRRRLAAPRVAVLDAVAELGIPDPADDFDDTEYRRQPGRLAGNRPSTVGPRPKLLRNSA